MRKLIQSSLTVTAVESSLLFFPARLRMPRECQEMSSRGKLSKVETICFWAGAYSEPMRKEVHRYLP